MTVSPDCGLWDMHSDLDVILFRKFISDFTEHIENQTCFDKEPRGNVNAVNHGLQIPMTLG